ncbi:hypothetical protein D1BOALGB6SA_471 [Olavius sp. associated proteobacterium Delta 1]|nr:hypothetical protein D1BOALGB6SA_471 [Olavius sp. associated proteobacterium Delta 1]
MSTAIYHARRKLTLWEAAELILCPPTSRNKDQIIFIRQFIAVQNNLKIKYCL